jgi:putative heme iron utilization protein
MYSYEGMPPSSCPECSKKVEDDYMEVREYVRENPGVTADDVARKFDIPHSQVMQYLKEERLSICERSQWFLKCRDCGAKILSGTYCNECSRH